MTPKNPTCDLVQRLDLAIQGNPHLAGHQVFCQEQQGVVVLQGRVRSYFQKQMAQEILRRFDGVERIVNALEVDWGHHKSPNYAR